MNVLSLDISTKPGWALYLDNTLVKFGTLFANKSVEDFGSYPENYILFCQHTAQRLYKEVIHPALTLAKGDLIIVIEETTASKNNYSQRKLEWIHMALLNLLQGMRIFYVRDGVWKNKVGARQNKEEKALNAKIARQKKKTGEKLAKLDLDGSGKARVVGKLGPKHYVLRAVKEQFGLVLSITDEDAADAICIGLAFLKGVPVCDGTPFGGLERKAKS